MPRGLNIRGVEGRIYPPRRLPINYDIKINDISVFTDVIASEFTRAIVPETGSFKINLLNSDGSHSNIEKGQDVDLFLDLADGDTLRFAGEVTSLKNIQNDEFGFVLEVAGYHKSTALLDITVTESYTGLITADAILKELVDEYTTGFTYTNVSATTFKPTINWNNKPFLDCIADLVRLTSFDCYIDETLDFNFFKKNSINNEEEAVIMGDTFISSEGLGTQSTDVKNKIIVYGDDGTNLPIISTSEDSGSQSLFGIKESVIFDNKITTLLQADELSDSTLTLNKDSELKGTVNSLIFTSALPGQMIWISNLIFKIRGFHRVIKYTHRLPAIETDFVVEKEKSLPLVLKQRVEKELALQTVTNPFKMEHSLNFTFDDDSQMATKDSNVVITDGVIKLGSGTAGTATSISTEAENDVTSVHLKVKGSVITPTIFKFKTGGDTFKTITPEALTTVPAGKDLTLFIDLRDTATEIDSVAILYK